MRFVTNMAPNLTEFHTTTPKEAIKLLCSNEHLFIRQNHDYDWGSHVETYTRSPAHVDNNGQLGFLPRSDPINRDPTALPHTNPSNPSTGIPSPS